MAVSELGVVQHAVERLEHRQRILQEAVLQQPQHVGLRLDPALGDRDHAHERVIDRHHGLPAARRVVERVAPDHRLLELGRAARRQAHRIEVVERDLEDFGGLAAAIRALAAPAISLGDSPLIFSAVSSDESTMGSISPRSSTSNSA